LKVFGECYKTLGEDIWRLLGNDIPIKVKGLLEQRFKNVVKQATANGGLGASTGLNKSSNANSLNRSIGGGNKLKFATMNRSQNKDGSGASGSAQTPT